MKKLYLIPIICTLTSLFCFCNFIFFILLDSIEDIDIFDNKKVEKKSYSLNDTYKGNSEIELFHNIHKIESIKKVYSDLEKNSIGNYFITNDQGLWIVYDNKITIEKMRYKYEEGEMSDDYDSITNGSVRVKHLVLNEKTYTFFDLTVSDGRMLKTEDHYFVNLEDYIPILMGNEYKNVFSVGDDIRIGYYTMSFNAKIVGFLSPGEYIINEGQVVNLNRYIITPCLLFPNSPSNDNEMFFQAAVTLDNINGTIILNDENNLHDLVLFLNEFQEKYGVEKFDLLEISSKITDAMSAMNAKNKPTFIFLTICIILYSIFMIYFSFISVIEKKKLKYAIDIIYGKGIKKILFSTNIYALCVFIISHVCAAKITLFYGQESIKYGFNWVIISLLFFISIIAVNLYIVKLPVWNIIKGSK